MQSVEWRWPLLYAREVIELMGSYPGRDFRMVEIVRYVTNGRTLDLKGRRSLRRGVLRVVLALSESGSVLIDPPQHTRGGFAHYRWKSET